MPALSILIVDPNPIFAQCAQRFLARWEQIGAIDWAVDMAEALAKIRARCPAVVFLEISLLEKEGFCWGEKLKGDLPGVKIIGLSTFHDDYYRQAREKGGLDGLIAKENFGDLSRGLIRSLFPHNFA